MKKSHILAIRMRGSLLIEEMGGLYAFSPGDILVWGEKIITSHSMNCVCNYLKQWNTCQELGILSRWTSKHSFLKVGLRKRQEHCFIPRNNNNKTTWVEDPWFLFYSLVTQISRKTIILKSKEKPELAKREKSAQGLV